MPTSIPSGEKSAFIAIVNSAPYPGGAAEATELQTILNNFEDIPTVIGRQINLYAENDAYLIECMGVFAANDSDLVVAGIYNNKSGSAPCNDPLLIINSNLTGGVNITANSPGFGLFGTSTVNKVTLSADVDLENLYIGPGCSVDILDSSNSGAFVNNIWLPFAKSTPSILKVAKTGSSIGAVWLSAGSYYGGIQNIDPEAACAAGPVTGLAAGQVTHDSIVLMWTPPSSGYIFINVQYKKSDSSVWLGATEANGDYIQSVGFIFRGLDADTYYDFRIQVVCLNGGVAYAMISSKTVCCGSSGTFVPATNCLINILIKDTPDPTKLIYLCNGVAIQQEYATGPTLTIAYLAGKNITDVIIVSNIPYQDMPYNSVTGTWDASGTDLVLFQEPNVVSIRVQLPI